MLGMAFRSTSHHDIKDEHSYLSQRSQRVADCNGALPASARASYASPSTSYRTAEAHARAVSSDGRVASSAATRYVSQSRTVTEDAFTNKRSYPGEPYGTDGCTSSEWERKHRNEQRHHRLFDGLAQRRAPSTPVRHHARGYTQSACPGRGRPPSELLGAGQVQSRPPYRRRRSPYPPYTLSVEDSHPTEDSYRYAQPHGSTVSPAQSSCFSSVSPNQWQPSAPASTPAPFGRSVRSIPPWIRASQNAPSPATTVAGVTRYGQNDQLGVAVSSQAHQVVTASSSSAEINARVPTLSDANPEPTAIGTPVADAGKQEAIQRLIDLEVTDDQLESLTVAASACVDALHSPEPQGALRSFFAAEDCHVLPLLRKILGLVSESGTPSAPLDLQVSLPAAAQTTLSEACTPLPSPLAQPVTNLSSVPVEPLRESATVPVAPQSTPPAASIPLWQQPGGLSPWQQSSAHGSTPVVYRHGLHGEDVAVSSSAVPAQSFTPSTASLGRAAYDSTYNSEARCFSAGAGFSATRPEVQYQSADCIATSLRSPYTDLSSAGSGACGGPQMLPGSTYNAVIATACHQPLKRSEKDHEDGEIMDSNSFLTAGYSFQSTRLQAEKKACEDAGPATQNVISCMASLRQPSQGSVPDGGSLCMSSNDMATAAATTAAVLLPRAPGASDSLDLLNANSGSCSSPAMPSLALRDPWRAASPRQGAVGASVIDDQGLNAHGHREATRLPGTAAATPTPPAAHSSLLSSFPAVPHDIDMGCVKSQCTKELGHDPYPPLQYAAASSSCSLEVPGPADGPRKDSHDASRSGVASRHMEVFTSCGVKDCEVDQLSPRPSSYYRPEPKDSAQSESPRPGSEEAEDASPGAVPTVSHARAPSRRRPPPSHVGEFFRQAAGHHQKFQSFLMRPLGVDPGGLRRLCSVFDTLWIRATWPIYARRFKYAGAQQKTSNNASSNDVVPRGLGDVRPGTTVYPYLSSCIVIEQLGLSPAVYNHLSSEAQGYLIADNTGSALLCVQRVSLDPKTSEQAPQQQPSRLFQQTIPQRRLNSSDIICLENVATQWIVGKLVLVVDSLSSIHVIGKLEQNFSLTPNISTFYSNR